MFCIFIHNLASVIFLVIWYNSGSVSTPFVLAFILFLWVVADSGYISCKFLHSLIACMYPGISVFASCVYVCLVCLV